MTENGKTVGMKVAGNSMVPFLVHERDCIFFAKPVTPLKKGDMVFYQRKDGQFIMHRICKISSEGVYTVGDAQTIIEGPLDCNQIFARVVSVERKSKKIDSTNLCWKFFQYLWIRMIPLRPFVMNIYRFIHH